MNLCRLLPAARPQAQELPARVPEPRDDGDEQTAARQWADQEAERIGAQWKPKHPGRGW